MISSKATKMIMSRVSTLHPRGSNVAAQRRLCVRLLTAPFSERMWLALYGHRRRWYRCCGCWFRGKRIEWDYCNRRRSVALTRRTAWTFGRDNVKRQGGRCILLLRSVVRREPLRIRVGRSKRRDRDQGQQDEDGAHGYGEFLHRRERRCPIIRQRPELAGGPAEGRPWVRRTRPPGAACQPAEPSRSRPLPAR
jgi:hypothetical protein